MKEFKYVIKDEQGIHARPAGLFVKEAAAFPCKVIIEKDGKEADAKRIFAVMGLAVKCGQEITLKTDGENEEEAMNKLSAFLEENLQKICVCGLPYGSPHLYYSRNHLCYRCKENCERAVKNSMVKKQIESKYSFYKIH